MISKMRKIKPTTITLRIYEPRNITNRFILIVILRAATPPTTTLIVTLWKLLYHLGESHQKVASLKLVSLIQTKFLVKEVHSVIINQQIREILTIMRVQIR